VTTAIAQDSSGPSLTIGAILPLTGSSAAFGLASKRGIELALDDLSASDKARLKVIIEDDGLNNSRSVSAAQKLITIDKADALLTWSSGTALAVGGLSEGREIPQLAVASDPAVSRNHRYSFNYWPIPETETKTLYDYLRRTNKRRVAMITQVSSFTLSMRDAFAHHVQSDGELQIIADEEVSSDATDMRSTLLKIKAKGDVDGLILAFWPGQLALVVKQARELGISAPFFGYETFEDKATFEAAGGLLRDAIYSTGADARPDFLEKFRRRYPGESDYTASHSYDIIMLFVEATRERKDGASIARFLRTLRKYPSASGELSSTGDNRFTLPTTLKRLDAHGEPQPLNQ
jgi:branched-chain amino acid transport system substrate-binding protein